MLALAAWPLLALFVSSAAATPAHEANLAYRSPYANVPADFLAHDISHIVKRDGASADSYRGKLTFPWGVASGDADEKSAIIWTHPVPADNVSTVCLKYETSTSKTDWSKKSVVDSGEVKTTRDVDYSVKLETKKLKPYTKYYYRFSSCADSSNVSPVGSFKTVPKEGDKNAKFNFAVFTCSNYPNGYFTAYGNAASRKKSDAWLHLGDYIYEYAGTNPTTPGRVPSPPREIVTLDDYRLRYKTYHTDEGLRSIRQELGLYATWDDHEVADNTWKAGSADSNDTVAGEVYGVKFSQRKANAMRAYVEWMPIRPGIVDRRLRLWREQSFANLLDLVILDTRQWDRDVTDVYYNTAYIASIANNTDRTIMGFDQEAWASQRLKSASKRATWKVVQQQVIMNPLKLGSPTFPTNFDAWDGYSANRERFLKTVKEHNIDNVIVLTGDTHANWAFDGSSPDDLEKYDPVTGKGSYYVEFGVTAVSSTSSYGKNLTAAQYQANAENLVRINKNLQYAEGDRRGYYEMSFTRDKLTTVYLGVDDINNPRSGVTELARFEVNAGDNHIARPMNGGRPPVSGAIQEQTVNYKTQKWNGTAFA